MASPIELDEALVQLSAVRDDRSAWETLFAWAWPFVLAACFRELGGAKHLAEDAAQEVFLKLARYCPFGEIDDADAMRAYAGAVSRNVCRDQLRTFLRRADAVPIATIEAFLEDEGPSPEDELELAEELDQVLNMLEPRDRLVLELYVAGFKLSEIAETTGSTTNAIGTRVHRIKARARNWLADKDL